MLEVNLADDKINESKFSHQKLRPYISCNNSQEWKAIFFSHKIIVGWGELSLLIFFFLDINLVIFYCYSHFVYLPGFHFSHY